MVKRAHPTAEVFALDADVETPAIARTKLAQVGIKAQLDQGLASALPYLNDSFDRDLSSLLFHHLSSELKREATREVLRQGTVRSSIGLVIGQENRERNSAETPPRQTYGKK